MQLTQHFKNYWKVSLERDTLKGSRAAFLVALSSVSIVLLFLFLVLHSINNEVYRSQRTPLPLHRLEHVPPLTESRLHGVSLTIQEYKPGVTQIAFDDGTMFELPAQQEALKKYAKKRVDVLVQMAMLMMTETPASNRVQIWPAKSVNFETVRSIVAMLTEVGFDDFDIAVDSMSAQKD